MYLEKMSNRNLPLSLAVGLTTLSPMEDEKPGWAKYAPLWWVRGGEAWTPTVSEKKANTKFAFFSSFQPIATGYGLPLPL